MKLTIGQMLTKNDLLTYFGLDATKTLLELISTKHPLLLLFSLLFVVHTNIFGAQIVFSLTFLDILLHEDV